MIFHPDGPWSFENPDPNEIDNPFLVSLKVKKSRMHSFRQKVQKHVEAMKKRMMMDVGPTDGKPVILERRSSFAEL